MDAQRAAACLAIDSKSSKNPESTVGLVKMAPPEALSSCTTDIGTVLRQMEQMQLEGRTALQPSIQIAQLVLKRRPTREQAQRVIVFIGSPIAEDKASLEKLGKQLRRSNIALDVVSFGEVVDNTEKLETLVNAANKDGNSHLVTIPPGPSIMADCIISSPIIDASAIGTITGGVRGPAGAATGGDLSQDPELAWALEQSRMEMEAQEKAAIEASKKSDAATPAGPSGTAAMELDDDALMQQALLMSLEGAQAATPEHKAPPPPSAPATSTPATPAPAPAAPAAKPTGAPELDSDMVNVLADEEFVRKTMIDQGLDPDDPTVQALIASLRPDHPAPAKPAQQPPKEEKKDEKKE
eukprot:GAFH01002379.1.p1 GENE.GAFH01002379.1~~GAFH01002379.1.p1  ORF type:complete len:391 (-),score=40.84 GAFH01002379.1:19-1080(-)